MSGCGKCDWSAFETAMDALRATLGGPSPLPVETRLGMCHEATALLQSHTAFVLVPSGADMPAGLVEPSPQLLELMARAGVTA